MKRRHVALVVLTAASLLLWAGLAALPRLGRYGETARALNVLTDCYQFVFRATMDSAGLDTPAALPRKLDEVPGWQEHVAGVTNPAFRKYYKLIDWHPPENAATNDEIASIALSHGRVIVLQGGSAYARLKTP